MLVSEERKKPKEEIDNLYATLSAVTVLYLITVIVTFFIVNSCAIHREKNLHLSSASGSLKPIALASPARASAFNKITKTKSPVAIKNIAKKEKTNKKSAIKSVKKAVCQSKQIKKLVPTKNILSNSTSKKIIQKVSKPAESSKVYNPKILWVKKTNNSVQIANTSPPPLGSITLKTPPDLNAANRYKITKIKCSTASGGYAYSNDANSNFFLN